MGKSSNRKGHKKSITAMVHQSPYCRRQVFLAGQVAIEYVGKDSGPENRHSYVPIRMVYVPRHDDRQSYSR